MMKNEHLTRQMDIIPIDVLGTPITVIGAGAIGSWVTLALAKMGLENITVFDHDVVDTVNMNSQFYRYSDIGKHKVKALHDLVKDFTNVEITAVARKYESGHFPGIVIMALDSMGARKLVWDNHKRKALATRAIIDPRMGAESLLMYCVNPMAPDEITKYEKTLYSDDAALPEPCTNKAIIYSAHLISGLVCKAVKDQIIQKPDYLRTALWDVALNDCNLFCNQVSA